MTDLLQIIATVADKAMCHRQSVERRLLGLPIRGRVGQRIDAELARHGFTPGAPVTSASKPSE